MDKKEYTSARLISKNKGDWKYGKIEVRAMLPQGRGLWPAVWMLPTKRIYGDWPACGEIDIMEHVGYNPDSVFSTVHTKSFNHIIGTQKSKAIKLDNEYDNFHIYSIEWNADKIDFFLDGRMKFTFLNSGNGFAEWPFDQSFFLIMNLAVGGNWGGKHGIDNSVFPAITIIDYVRVYE
jgi:beta-glucanase (GH16 family)